VHDLAEGEKHCASCDQDLRHIGEEVSERYEYILAQMLVIEDACQKYACACTVKTATKPVQPIEKSTAGASLLAQVIVSKVADHLPIQPASKDTAAHGSGDRRPNDVWLDAAKRGTAGSPVWSVEKVRVGIEGGRHR
jgi:transposase